MDALLYALMFVWGAATGVFLYRASRGEHSRFETLQWSGLSALCILALFLFAPLTTRAAVPFPEAVKAFVSPGVLSLSDPLFLEEYPDFAQKVGTQFTWDRNQDPDPNGNSIANYQMLYCDSYMNPGCYGPWLPLGNLIPQVPVGQSPSMNIPANTWGTAAVWVFDSQGNASGLSNTVDFFASAACLPGYTPSGPSTCFLSDPTQKINLSLSSVGLICTGATPSVALPTGSIIKLAITAQSKANGTVGQHRNNFTMFSDASCGYTFDVIAAYGYEQVALTAGTVLTSSKLHLYGVVATDGNVYYNSLNTGGNGNADIVGTPYVIEYSLVTP